MTNAPEWFETFSDLHGASTVEELWAVLLSWHGIRSSTQWEEPYVLFHRFHAEEPAGAVVTAVLLCTDTRWRKASHHVIVRIIESGVLTAAEERQLAEWFAAPSIAVEAEGKNLEGPEIRLVARADGFGRHRRKTTAEPEVRVIERSIWPPLRRWAAARQVAENPIRWRSLLEAAAALPSRDTAALAAGVMDAAANIPLAERSHAIAAGLDSGSGIVRLAALSTFAVLEGSDVALARASADPSGKVRAWTPMVKRAEEPGFTAPLDETVDPPQAGAAGQGSLF